MIIGGVGERREGGHDIELYGHCLYLCVICAAVLYTLVSLQTSW